MIPRSRFLAISALTPALAVAIAPLRACDLCSVYNAPLAHGIFEAGWHAGLSEQFTRFGTIQLESHEVPNPAHQWLDSSVSQLSLGYHFNDTLGVQLTLPEIYRSFRRAEGGAIDRGDENGLGDALLLGRYVAFRRDRESWSVAWSLLAGVKFPTGDPHRLREELEEETPVPGEVESAIHGHDLALGSGSYDGLVGSQLFARWRRVFFTTDVQYAIRSRGAFGYRYANDLLWEGGPGYHLVFKEDFTLSLRASVSGESKGRDHFRAEKAEDTSVTAVYLGPRLSVSWKGRVSAEVGAALPVDIQNSALQAVPDYRVLAALSLRF